MKVFERNLLAARFCTRVWHHFRRWKQKLRQQKDAKVELMDLLHFNSTDAFYCLLLINDVLTILITWNCHLRLRGTASSGFSQLILRKHLLKSINAVFCFPELFLELAPCASLCFEVGWEQSAWALSPWSMVVSPSSSRSGSAGQGFHTAHMNWSCLTQAFQKLLWKTLYKDTPTMFSSIPPIFTHP